MSDSQLPHEIRTKVRCFVHDELSLHDFRVWFGDADRRAYRGAPSGLADPIAMALIDGIENVLSDLDDGFIEIEDVAMALRIEMLSDNDIRRMRRDATIRHLVRRTASMLTVVPVYVSA